jgi:hypothetical protein
LRGNREGKRLQEKPKYERDEDVRNDLKEIDDR